MRVEYIHRDMVHRMSRCFTASVKYIFISIIRSISYGLVKCTGLLIDFINLLCIPDAFVHKSVVYLRTGSVAWLSLCFMYEGFNRDSTKNIRSLKTESFPLSKGSLVYRILVLY